MLFMFNSYHFTIFIVWHSLQNLSLFLLSLSLFHPEPHKCIKVAFMDIISRLVFHVKLINFECIRLTTHAPFTVPN